MKHTVLILLGALLIFSCAPKKTETTEVFDSTAVSAAADTPASSALAFSLSPGYVIKNTVALSDTVNIYLLTNQAELDEKFAKQDDSAVNPDFLINYVVAIVCLPRLESKIITLERVEATDAINVYFNITVGEKQPSLSKPAQIFFIEKRTDITSMQVFVNGKQKKDFFLAGL